MTGMVTLGNTQNYSEFELHARAILGIPVHTIPLLQNGASAVVLALHKAEGYPAFGLDKAAAIPNTDFKFWKTCYSTLQKNGGGISLRRG